MHIPVESSESDGKVNCSRSLKETKEGGSKIKCRNIGSRLKKGFLYCFLLSQVWGTEDKEAQKGR